MRVASATRRVWNRVLCLSRQKSAQHATKLHLLVNTASHEILQSPFEDGEHRAAAA
jgi:hypothetical protein